MENKEPVLRVLVTGAGGFLGWHLRCLLSTLKGIEQIPLDHGQFEDDETLGRAVAGCDVVAHLAGVNRGEPGAIMRENTRIARRLTEAMEARGVSPSVIFASSTHIFRGTEYGESKIRAGEELSSWAAKAGARFVNLIIPNVFGELCRPHYNSVVATFCHELTQGRKPAILQDNEYEYIHSLDVCRHIVKSLNDGVSGDVKLRGEPMKVSALLNILEGMHEKYSANVIPSLPNEFHLRLFNTYRSYTGRERGFRLEAKSDARGSLFEAVRALQGGQLFYSTTRPGVVRGNHFHLTKFERFLVVSGKAVIRLRKIGEPRITEVEVDGENPMCVDIPTLHTHNIENVGVSDLYTLFWTNAFFDPENPDTYYEKVESDNGKA